MGHIARGKYILLSLTLYKNKNIRLGGVHTFPSLIGAIGDPDTNTYFVKMREHYAVSHKVRATGPWSLPSLAHSHIEYFTSYTITYTCS